MYSQLGADIWVEQCFPQPGFFVDVGCADGVIISNTYGLEQKGWKGICIDAYPRNFEGRTCILEQAVLGAESGTEVEFMRGFHDPNLSGIVSGLAPCKKFEVMSNGCEIVKHVTKSLCEILDKHGAPSFIEYMSMDIEGAEYDVLSTFPFDKYTFGCLTIEHNFQEPKRTMIRELLEKNGYVFTKHVEYDDWYKRSESV